MSNTVFTDNALLSAKLGKTNYTAPANVYFGLSTTTPSTAGTGVTEPSGGAYARVAVPGSSWNAPSAGSATNSAAITFPTASASWGTVTYVVAYDAITAGNLLWFSSITAQAVASGVTVSIPAGSATDSLS